MFVTCLFHSLTIQLQKQYNDKWEDGCEQWIWKEVEWSGHNLFRNIILELSKALKITIKYQARYPGSGSSPNTKHECLNTQPQQLI